MITALQAGLLTDVPGVSHGFFGRRGGVSTGLYSSLNCGYGSDDDPTRVQENRTRVSSQLGAGEGRLITVYQIHSCDAVHVVTPWRREDAPQADAMATTERGIALGVLAADCAPVLLADGGAGVIGSAHAGWQGAFKGVAESVVSLMERLGARRGRIRAYVGPCIGQANYETGPEFYKRFVDAEPDFARYFVASRREGHWQFDLPGFVADRLRQSGVDQVDAAGICTYSHADDYFSFRRTTHRGENVYGRNLSAIMLVP